MSLRLGKALVVGLAEAKDALDDMEDVLVLCCGHRTSGIPAS